MTTEKQDNRGAGERGAGDRGGRTTEEQEGKRAAHHRIAKQRGRE